MSTGTSSNYQEPVLTSLRTVDGWRRETEWSRPDGSNLDILEEPFLNSTGTALCQLVVLNTYGKSAATEQAAAVALALQHLNVGDGTRVPELEGLDERCPVRFSLKVFDTSDIPAVANYTLHGTNMPCAFLGAASSSISMLSSIWTGLRGYPQISPTSTSSQLSDRDMHPLFGRTIPSDLDNADVYLQFFTQVLGITHLMILNGRDDYGSSLVDDIMHRKETNETQKIDLFFVAVDNSPPSMQQAISLIKQRQYRYIWSLLQPPVVDTFMEMASDLKEYHWFFGDTFSSVLHQRSFQAGSVLEQAYRGVGLLEATGAGLEEFQEELAKLDNPTDLEYLESILPEGLDVQSVLQDGSSNLGFSVFAYHAAIAIGLAACEAQEDLYLSGTSHFDQIMNTSFQDLSGENVMFHASTGSRIAETAFYRVRNYVPETATDGTVIFRDVTTHVYYNDTWIQLEEFIFRDNTTTIPPDLPPGSVEQELISMGVRATLLFFCGLIVCQALGFMYWTERHKKSRVVLASQPFFLHTICVGIIILGTAIIPLTTDHAVADDRGCEMACTARVWLVALGFATTMSAFLAKTHRINRILNHPNKFKRIKVSVRQVAVPMIASLVVSTILLSLMTVFSPPDYQVIVEEVDEFGRPSRIEGRCNWAEAGGYMIALACINMIILVAAGWESYKARNLSTEFSESQYVFRALVSTLSVAFVGIPLVLLTDENPNALAFASSAIIFVSSTSILLFMFLPKMNQLAQLNAGVGVGAHGNKKGEPISLGGDKGPRWKVSGLECGPTGIPATATSPISMPNGNGMVFPAIRSNSSSSDLKGMKILTTKNKSELLQENEQLAATLDELKQLIETADSIESLRVALGLGDQKMRSSCGAEAFWAQPPTIDEPSEPR